MLGPISYLVVEDGLVLGVLFVRWRRDFSRVLG